MSGNGRAAALRLAPGGIVAPATAPAVAAANSTAAQQSSAAAAPAGASTGAAEREGDERRGPAVASLAGAEVVLDPLGVLWWPAQETLIVSDLHLEHGSSLACRRNFVPPYDTGVTLARLRSAVERYRPSRVVALGDSFHDPGGPARMAPEHARALRALVGATEWVWIAGNHDDGCAAVVGGRATRTLTLGGIVLRHIPSAASAGPEIAGHLHPSARISRRGRSLRRRCFVGCERRLVMPAFGALTGGLNLLDPAWRELWPCVSDHQVFMIGRERVYAVSPQSLLPH